MAIKVTDDMFAKCVDTNNKIQNLQAIRNSDFLTNPIQIISNNLEILKDYFKNYIQTRMINIQVDTILMTYIFNCLESFNAFRDKKYKLIKDSKVTENEKKILFNEIINIEGTETDPKTLRIVNSIRNHFHHERIKGIKMNTIFKGNNVENTLLIDGHDVIELFGNALNDAIRVKKDIIDKINYLMSLYDNRENLLMYNAYCRSHNLKKDIYVLYPEETVEELGKYE